ncbi:hypothetical protein BHE74_00008791 [Ensete ventricosum]|nr:hypothetical protein BHE74_00008791 [Ensete ventricosum]
MVNSGISLGDLAERVNLGTNPGDLAERVNSSTNPGDLAERVNSGTNPGDLAEKVNSGVNPGDLAERVNSDINPGDLVERVNSGINPGDLVQKVNSGANPGDLAERVNSGTNPGDLAEKVNSGINPGDLAKMVNSGTNIEDLAEKVNSGTNPGDLAERADHDLDMAVTKGSLAVIRGRYSIPAEFGLHVPLDWSAHPIDNASLNLSEEEFVLVGRLKGILSSSCAIKEMTDFWLVKTGLSPASRGTVMLPCFSFLSCFLTCESGCRSDGSRRVARDVEGVWRQGPLDSYPRRHKKVKVLTRRHKSRHDKRESRSHSKDKKPAALSEEPDTPVESDEGGASPVHHRPRSMKDLFKTKVHKDDVGYYTLQMSDLGHQDPDKEMKARWRGLKNSTKVWNDSSAAEEFERGLLHSQLARELYTLPSEVLLAQAAKEMVLQELDTLKFGEGPEAVAKAEERASELGQELKKTKWERDEALLWLEAFEKDLSEVRSNLAEVQRLLKEARVRAWKMDDELLHAVKALENARTELPRQAVIQYKESIGFKEGLKRMGRVTYEYEYRVALARFHARHPDLEVEEDPFTIHPEDDLVPMERQQEFGDSDPPEP